MIAVKNTLLSILMMLDTLIYWIVSVVYRVFILVSKASLYNTSDTKIKALTDRIFVILGVAMLFVMAYNIILLIMNPDKMSNGGDKSLQGLLKNLVISVVILTLLPTIFDYMSRIQNNILDSQVIENVILGSASESDSKISTEDMGDKISTMLFSIFYHPVDDNGNIIMYADCKNENFSNKPKICDDYVKAYEKAETTGWFTSFMDDSLMNELSTGIFNPVANMQYIWGISAIVGLVCLFMFATYVFDIGVRLVKLTFLQIIAPVPVILRITKPSGGIFSKWLNMLIQTYTMLFTRLITIYFSVFTVGLIADGFMSVDGGIFGASNETNKLIILFGYLFVIIGIFLFAKEAPGLINNFTGGSAGGAFGWSTIKKKFSDAFGVASSIPVVGRPFSKATGGLTGGLGGLSTALQNRKAGINAVDALKQGAALGFNKGGLQYGSQRAKTFQDRYGYDKKQSIFGGETIDAKLKSKYGSLVKDQVKENARRANEDYIKNELNNQIPVDNAGIISGVDNLDDINNNFAAISSTYANAAKYVDEQAKNANIQLSSSERKDKINERLVQMAATTTDENEKRSINSYLKRESIIKSYDESSLSGNADAVQKLKDLASKTTRANVESQIERNGIDNVITDQSVKNQIEANVNTKMNNANGDVSKLGFNAEQLSTIKAKANKKLEQIISQNGGTLANVVLPSNVTTAVQATIDAKVNSRIAESGGATNITLNGGDASIKATLDAKKVQFELDANAKVDMSKVDMMSKLTADEEKTIRDYYSQGDNVLPPNEIDKKVQEAADKKKQDVYEKEVERIAQESYDKEYKVMYESEVKKQLATECREEATKEVLKKGYELQYAKEEVKAQEVSEHLYNEQYDAVENSLKTKEAEDIKSKFKEYAEGLANGSYTREDSGKKDKAYSKTYEDNEKIIEKGVKTKSELDTLLDDLKKFKESQEKDKKS